MTHEVGRGRKSAWFEMGGVARRRFTALVIAAAIGLGAAACDGSEEDGSKATSHVESGKRDPTGTIVFSHDFADDIFSMSPVRGSRVRQLTKFPGGQFDPSWSPDGHKIVFRDSRAGINRNDEIYLMNDDGSSVHNLTRNSANDWSPAWSPDGARIVFASTRGDGILSLWTMQADGGGAERLTSGTDEYPAWSPKGDWIAFGRGLPQSDIWLVRPDGSESRALTNSLEPEWQPAWSPDGKRIVYVRGYERQTTLWIMSADGSRQRQLTRVKGDTGPSWAPDGSRLVFSRNGTLYLVDPEGGTAQSLGIEGTLASWGK